MRRRVWDQSRWTPLVHDVEPGLAVAVVCDGIDMTECVAEF